MSNALNPRPRLAAKWHTVRSSLLLLAICLSAISAVGQATDLPVKPKGDVIDVPAKPTGYVNDYAHVLSPAARAQLEALCTEVNDKAKAQIFVVIVPSLGDRALEDYSLDIATKWGVGPKQSSSGVLIFFAINDRKNRIEVGYGLEPILPDGKVGGFTREAVPYLRAGNYDAALLLITGRVADVIAADRGVTLNARPSPAARPNDSGKGNASGLLGLFILGIFIFILYSIMSRGGGSGRGGFGGGGGGFGGGGGGSFGGGGASGSW